MFMITVHELGHYLVGKWLGFRITEFSIGFGKPLFKRVNPKTGEVFAIRMIPLGGYCAFAGEDDAGSFGAGAGKAEDATYEEMARTASDRSAGEEPEYQPTGELWDKQPPWKRLLALFAGSAFNFICAIIFCMILVGVIGYNQGNSIYSVRTHAVTEAGNEVTNVNHAVLNRNEVIRAIRASDSDEWQYFTLLSPMQTAMGQFQLGDTPVLRLYTLDGEFLRNQQVTIQRFENAITGNVERGIGITIGGLVPIRIGFFEVLGRGFIFAFEIAWAILVFLGALITGRMGINNLMGPIGTMGIMTESIGINPVNILLLIPMLSVNLAVFNLLPIPALDGARMIFVGIEWVRKKPINRDIEGRIHMIGLLCLMAFVLFVEINFAIQSRLLFELWPNAPPW